MTTRKVSFNITLSHVCSFVGCTWHAFFRLSPTLYSEPTHCEASCGGNGKSQIDNRTLFLNSFLVMSGRSDRDRGPRNPERDEVMRESWHIEARCPDIIVNVGLDPASGRGRPCPRRGILVRRRLP